MDVKSLAKSKRAHSQHHNKKHHPNQKSKAPSAGSVAATNANKPPGKQIKGKSPQFQGSSGLSSNWDRYEDEYEFGSENPSQDSSSQLTDVIVPKSKGADYAYLISEAMAHSQSTSSSESFPSFDDVFTDFNQGVGSLVSVRGQSILSWTRDDNFLVEDQANTSHEASFLSLDLNALAKQLEKVDLSRRLFIEEDLFPQELSTSIAALDQYIETKITSSDSAAAATTTLSTTTTHQVPSIDHEGSKSKNKVKDEPVKIGRTGQSTVLKPAAEPNAHSIANPNKSSKFEAVAAEAELDMLLDSINETNFLDSSGSASSTYQQEVSFDLTVPTLLKGRDLSKSALSSNLDVTIDDLLNETSSVINRSDELWSHMGNAPPVIKGPDLSKPVVAANLDDTIDDLLKETSSSGLINRNDTLKSREVNADPFDVLSSPSSLPTSKSKLLDDFDSWLDTI